MTDQSTLKDAGILNSKMADSTGKIIFEDNILCSQFLRDYIDLPYMKDVRPEDIEDVSEQYVPLFSEERNADRVKRVNIKNEKPFFLISLIEHKSKVDYNVSMQIFRYMVYIWEAYAKEAEKMQKGITRLAGFQYPPILPIVYYEGSDNWTVPFDFKSRIMEGETFGRYIPNFEYYLVPLHKYSNKELLAKKDEISLVMMINRMQEPQDVEEFRKLPPEEVESILEKTPEHLLEIISKILRAFLLRMKFSETETESLVGKVKEKKMGILFENVIPFDVEAERRKTQEVVEELKIIKEQNIKILIETCVELGEAQEKTLKRLQEKYGLSEEDAKEKLEQYWNK